MSLPWRSANQHVTLASFSAFHEMRIIIVLPFRFVLPFQVSFRMKEEYYQFTEDLKMKAWDILAPIIFLIQFASPETSSLSVTVLWLHMKCAFRPRILWGAASVLQLLPMLIKKLVCGAVLQQRQTCSVGWSVRSLSPHG